MTDTQAIYQYLGLAMRARKVITGEDLVVREIQSGKAKLVVLAEDASANTRKKLTDKCTSYNIQYEVFGNREDLGAAIGKANRVVVAIADEGFAKKISQLLSEYNRG